MIRKKRCSRCGKLIDKSFDYCPYCGAEQKKEKSDNLLDSINDAVDNPNSLDMDIFSKMFTGNFGKIVNNLARQIEKQMSEMDKHIERKPKSNEPFSGISISINTQTGKQPKIDVKSFGKNKLIKVPTANKNKLGGVGKTVIEQKFEQKASVLPRQEATSQVKRLSNKIIYEIDLPGVKSKKDIMIRSLSHSIEVKAVAKDKVYFKLIPISLPIISYDLSEGKLTLSLKPE